MSQRLVKQLKPQGDVQTLWRQSGGAINACTLLVCEGEVVIYSTDVFLKGRKALSKLRTVKGGPSSVVSRRAAGLSGLSNIWRCRDSDDAAPGCYAVFSVRFVWRNWGLLVFHILYLPVCVWGEEETYMHTYMCARTHKHTAFIYICYHLLETLLTGFLVIWGFFFFF